MARYIAVDTVIFTDTNGIPHSVKDRRDISTQTLSHEIDVKEGDLLDEIASRREVFGDFGENQAWRIFDLNIAELYQVDFDLSKIKRLKIPLRNSF